MKATELAVVGAGASGMMAALTAAELGRHVVLLERQSRVGRKLMATGNGRCNLTNKKAAPPHYHGGDVGFLSYAMEQFSVRATLEYFKSIGLLTVEERDGRVYPLSDSANSVADSLRYALEIAGVETMASCPVRSVAVNGKGFVLNCEGETIEAEKLIIACGGAAGEKLGGVCDGYELLGQLGHSRTKIYPALCQIRTKPEFPRSLKGVRADVKITVRQGEANIAESEGEALFTEVGVSGPAAFDVSRAVSTAKSGKLSLELDFLRNYSKNEVLEHIMQRQRHAPNLQASELWTGALHNRLGRMIYKFAGIEQGKTLCELSKAETELLAETGKGLVLPVLGTDGFSAAQVTVGGMRCSEFNDKTLESRLVPGLFACGEVLDIDGDCGGYNLQWAWSSGRLAGRLGK